MVVYRLDVIVSIDQNGLLCGIVADPAEDCGRKRKVLAVNVLAA
jgi:hypothetical protein